ncbi:hypothetical protein RDI58_010729 [Solanum bulbocastanum]|uniref:Alcohol dehydrogenase-like C-terminal domain-containing protein n=1 Tax=Solanum bulbocastanum TaxID=147425 RepID=A0AAN8TVB4_SOLBU
MCNSKLCFVEFVILIFISSRMNGAIVYIQWHEVVGVVTEIGTKVEKFKIGDKVGVGGITINSPLKYFGLDKPGMHIGVVGLGGLGHMAVKFAKAFGTKVTVISISLSKKDEAIERLGADSFLVSRDPDQMQGAAGSLDGIIDTVSVIHPLLPLINLLKTPGKLAMLGEPENPLELPVFPLLLGRKLVAGSFIGGMKETQEMVDFAAKNSITPDVEVTNGLREYNIGTPFEIGHEVSFCA